MSSSTSAMKRRIVGGLVAVAAVALTVASLGVLPDSSEQDVAPVAAPAAPAVPGTQGGPGASGPFTGSGICSDAGDFDDCWAEYFSEIARTEGVAEALTEIERAGEVELGIALTCHDWKHEVGREALVIYDGVIRDALQFDDYRCQYGFRHGVMESYAATADRDEMVDLMQTLCSEIDPASDAYQENLGECVHALGHAAAIYVQDDVVASVTLCDHMEPSELLQACAGGALMEYVNSWVSAKIADGTNPEVTPGVDLSNPFGPGNAQMDEDTARYLCERLPDRFSQECFLRVPNFWGPALGTDFATMWSRCETEAGEDRDMCARGIGEWVQRMAANAGMSEQERDDKARKIASWCGLAPTGEENGNCLIGAVFPVRQSELWAGRQPGELTEVCELVTDPAALKLCEKGNSDAERQYYLVNPSDTDPSGADPSA